jgi:hypothetical protein
MAFLLHSHRPYDQLPSQDVPQLAQDSPSRLHHKSATDAPAPPYDDRPPHVVQQPPAPTSSIQSAPNIVFDHPNTSPASMPKVPKVGETRCCALSNDRLLIIPVLTHPSLSFSPDWALLSSDLQFIYMDPIFTAHLEEQADALIGKSLLAFIHPDEQASAKHDLGNVVNSRTLHGSFTRCVLSPVLLDHTTSY